MFKKVKSAYYRTKYIEKMSPVYSITEMPDEDSATLFKYMDDEVLVIDKTLSKTLSAIFVTALLIPFGFSILIFIILGTDDESLFECILGGAFAIVVGTYSLYYIAYCLYRAKQVTTFHRLTGMIEVPKRFFAGWNGATLTFPFNDQYITWVPGFGGAMYRLSYPNSRASRHFLAADMKKEFSFILWFMDRNRQLPPSKRLDPYRVKDFLRREAEGFPAPLRRASIKIPSHKTVPPELKKERKQDYPQTN